MTLKIFSDKVVFIHQNGLLLLKFEFPSPCAVSNMHIPTGVDSRANIISGTVARLKKQSVKTLLELMVSLK